MSHTSDQRSEEFLRISSQFKLGALVTESSHPVTADLSEVAKQDIGRALELLFEVDRDVLAKYREFAASGRAVKIKEVMVGAIRNGGRLFFTGCGSTGRLSILLVSIWRDFWQRQSPKLAGTDFENRAFSVMAGGDFALIKSVEGFEDFGAFGRKQLEDPGVSRKDVVFAITEGGETSFVIGTAWKGIEAGAKVYFVYNNPDSVLCRHVERSREVIEDARIEKINLTTGPMAISGSTRMQATTIQLCVLLTVMEMAVRELSGQTSETEHGAGHSANVPGEFLAALEELHRTLMSREVVSQAARWVAMEESVYREGRRNNYYADTLGIDVLTDTTERSPTYCTPPFRKSGDTTASDSWAFLFLPYGTEVAWRQLLKRDAQCVEWDEAAIRELVPPEKAGRTYEIVRKISAAELMRFKIGTDGMAVRELGAGDSAVAILSAVEGQRAAQPSDFFRSRLSAAQLAGAKVGMVVFGAETPGIEAALRPDFCLRVAVPRNGFLLDGVTRVAVKMLMNAVSTCTMVRLGRVMGNCMIWVVASNLKLIDRATRYIQQLAQLPYEDANRLLFEVIEYVEPRMKSDRAYPPVVALAVLRARHGYSHFEAEAALDSAGSRPLTQRR